MQEAELESTAAERYHLESKLNEIQSGEWFEWYLNENTIPCGVHGEVYCLPCFPREFKDLKAVILEMKNHEADLREMFAPPADLLVTTALADPGPRSIATASVRRTLELYRRLHHKVRKGKLAKSVPPWALPRELPQTQQRP